ncbi:MAG TPA: formate dehydrogenase subunit gamma [Usitatibacter sp.]|nr:formate dehydrogenase subunit gamma [Usitatibacter sp.]
MRWTAWFALLFAAALMVVSFPALAQAQRAPSAREPAAAASETPPWQGVNAGTATIPGAERGVVIQERGKAWRALRWPVVTLGGWLLAACVAALAAFYLWRGPIGDGFPATGRLIERFAVADRVAHWTMGIGFVVLALTGLLLAAGRRALLPVVGYDAFSALALVSKDVHAFLGPLFIVCLGWFIARFAGDNLPRRHDLPWLREFGGMLSRKHVPSGRFNAGEKTLFWGLVCFFCAVLSVTGLVLDFPNLAPGRSLMQTASLVHLAVAFLAIAASLFHMYLGTVGVRGAFRAMRTGVVDESWAREHHEIWYEEVKAGRSRQHFVRPTPPQGALAPTGDD